MDKIKSRKFSLLLTEQFGSYYRQRIITITNDHDLVNIVRFQKNLVEMKILKRLGKEGPVREFNQKEEERKIRDINLFTKDFPEELKKDILFLIRVNAVFVTIDENTMQINTPSRLKVIIYKYGGWGIYYEVDKRPAKIISNGKDGISFGDAIDGAKDKLIYDYMSGEFLTEKAG